MSEIVFRQFKQSRESTIKRKGRPEKRVATSVATLREVYLKQLTKFI